MKVIALEEHFATAKARDLLPPDERIYNYPDYQASDRPDVVAALFDLGEGRIAAMDAAGVDMQILSLTTPGCQVFAPDVAVPLARETNDTLFEAIKAHPDRFGGFACLPTTAPAAAAKELERAVTQLRFQGALINGNAQGTFLDDKAYWPIFECAAALNVPIYMHPSGPHPDVMNIFYKGCPELARPAWGFAQQTSVHFLRLVFAGLFDAYPSLKIILGHLGEGLPFALERLDRHSHKAAARRGLKKTPAQYLTDNLVVTTSGNFSTAAFLCTLMTLGIDNILFSIDWPYESNLDGVQFLRELPLSDQDKRKVAHLNAERLLRLTGSSRMKKSK